MEQEKIFLSQETLDKYKKEYEKLVKVDRVEIQNALKEARAQGDLSENAEYDVARDKQAVVEARILELEGILDKAQLIKHKDENTISIGSKVTFLDLSTNKEDEVTIMGIHDADPFNKKNIKLLSACDCNDVKKRRRHCGSWRIGEIRN